MKTFRLSITSPEGNLFLGDVYQISVRGVEGELAIMAGHIPFATALAKGECRIYLEDGSVRRADVAGGLLTVNREETSLLSSSFVFREGA